MIVSVFNSLARGGSTARRLGLCCCLASMLCAPAAWAGLGGDTASVQSDKEAWVASSTQSTLAGATVFRQVLGNGVVVRQYVDTFGAVFAVGWEGPVQPDFERLLGAHFAAYLDAVQRARRGVSIQSAGLVLESGGMMRAFSGRAYVPTGVPAGFSVKDIR
jgi:hypothetical protein